MRVQCVSERDPREGQLEEPWSASRHPTAACLDSLSQAVHHQGEGRSRALDEEVLDRGQDILSSFITEF